ncbi:MAG: hydrogenase maturation protease, partial [Planctomycetota bacterium]
MRTLVLGLGNPVLTDDGVGWHVVRRLQPLLRDRADVDIRFCDRGGLRLMEEMVGYDRVVIVDALCAGSLPGAVRWMGPGEIRTQHSASAHDVNLTTALELGREIGASLPPPDEIIIVAVEASDVETFGERCTRQV